MKPRKKKKHPHKDTPASVEASTETRSHEEDHEPRDIEREDVLFDIGPDERGEVDPRSEP